MRPATDHKAELKQLAHAALELSSHAHNLERLSLPLDPYPGQIMDLAKELWRELAAFEGNQCFSVLIHYPTIFAADRESAIELVRDSPNSFDPPTVAVDGEPLEP